MRRGWTKQRAVTLRNNYGDARRIDDLQLALILPRSWPQYWLTAENVNKRVAETLDATKNERLPWSLS